MVSAPMSNISSVLSSTPWFFRLCLDQDLIPGRGADYSLPEAKLLASTKETFVLSSMTSLNELIVNDHQGHGGDAVREERKSNVRHDGEIRMG